MPFTLSHAAAAWPFRRTRLEFTALVTGCFAPDFAYFVFLRPHGFFGHTLLGIFVLDLPASLFALWLFHAYAKRPLTVFLPRGMLCRIRTSEEELSFWPPARLAIIVLSILVGAATHIAWDALTHKSFWPYRHLSVLRKIVQVPVLGGIGVYKLLQYGSTLFGLAFIALWILQWYRATEPSGQWKAASFSAAQRSAILVAIPALAVLGALIRALVGVGIPVGPGTLPKFVVEACISAITFFCMGLIVCGVLLRKHQATTQESREN
jgi:hypothetical protein